MALRAAVVTLGLLVAPVAWGGTGDMPSPPPALALPFMAGTWRTTDSVEAWFALGDGLVGVSASGAGKTQHHEVLWIETRGADLVYVARPVGQAPHDFVMTSRATGSARFEDPTHDFPKRIDYRLSGKVLKAKACGPGGCVKFSGASDLKGPESAATHEASEGQHALVIAPAGDVMFAVGHGPGASVWVRRYGLDGGAWVEKDQTVVQAP